MPSLNSANLGSPLGATTATGLPRTGPEDPGCRKQNLAEDGRDMVRRRSTCQ